MESSSLLSESIFAFTWAVLLCMFAIPSIIYLSYRKRLLDEPNNRTMHEDSTPRLGGLAIFASFASALTIFGDFSRTEDAIQQILAGCILLFFVGVKDDIAPVTAFKKFFVQVLATGIVVFLGDIRITSLHGFLEVIGLTNVGLSYAFTFVTIIAITNSINLIDGLNGLAGSLLVLISLIFGFLFYQINSALAILAFSMAGAVLGFLRYNFVQGKIFMGDSGSLVAGFVVAVLGVKFLESDLSESSVSPYLTISILVIPLFDTLRVFIIRMLQSKSPFTPDKNHIHHKLIRYGFSHITTVLILLLANLVVVGFAYFFGHRIGINGFVLSIICLALGASALFNYLDKKHPVYD